MISRTDQWRAVIRPSPRGTICEWSIARAGTAAVTFDDEGLVANAGLVLVATLSIGRT